MILGWLSFPYFAHRVSAGIGHDLGAGAALTTTSDARAPSNERECMINRREEDARSLIWSELFQSD